MNRFQKHSRPKLPGILLSLLLLFGAAWAMQQGLSTVSASTKAERMNSLDKAVRRAAVQCYALEGQYPPSLSYIEEKYGVIVDHDEFVVHYQAPGSNLMPEIKVFSLTQPQEDTPPQQEGGLAQ